MKLPKWAVFLIIAVTALTCRVSAASFTDDMAAPQNTAETRYSGLKPYTGATHGLSDQQLLTFLDPLSPQGHALYRVNAAESVTVGIYTAYGTCVLQKEAGLMLSQGTRQAVWSKSKDAVYSDFGGSFWRIELDFENRYDPVFSPINAMPSDAIGYGVNIYALPGTGRPLPASVTKSVSEPLVYEEYTAAIPAGTQYIKVEINDVTAYPLKGGGTMPNRITTSLASVRISGEALVMGEPAKAERQPTAQAAAPAIDDEEESEAYSATFAAADTPAAPEEPELEDEPAAPSEKASSSKFEGTITSSSRQEKSQASKAVVPSEAPAESSKRAESEASRDDPREAVYEIRRESSGDGMNAGVTAYIIIVSGALALLLIFGRKR